MPRFKWDRKLKIAGKKQTPEQYIRSVWCTLQDKDIADVITVVSGFIVTEDMISAKRKRLGMHKTRQGAPIIFDVSEAQRYRAPPVIESDNVLVMSDVHAPFHNAEWCSDVVDCAIRCGIKTCIIAGDLFDFAALSRFAKHIGINGDDIGIADEVDSAASFCDVLIGKFKRVVFTLGNHEKRLSARLAVKVRVSLIRALLGDSRQRKIEIYPYYFSIVQDKNGQRWRITHPRNYSVIPVRVAARLADKYNQHVVAGHGHDWGMTTSVSGRYAAACGCCADIERLDYAMLEDSTSPRMQNGAWMLVEGRPILLHPEYARPRDF